GTVFGVRNNGGVVRVAVAEGRVQAAFPMMVRGKPSGMVTRQALIAGQEVAATSDDGLRDVRPINVEQVGAWRAAALIYERATLSELVADANRYSEREIRLQEGADELGDLEITASFSGEDIDGLLSMLPQTFPVDVHRDGRGAIVIRQRSQE
ncbi:MAG: hypothetical protein AAGC77_11260, partial [Pseudomonadota bacterium]